MLAIREEECNRHKFFDWNDAFSILLPNSKSMFSPNTNRARKIIPHHKLFYLFCKKRSNLPKPNEIIMFNYYDYFPIREITMPAGGLIHHKDCAIAIINFERSGSSWLALWIRVKRTALSRSCTCPVFVRIFRKVLSGVCPVSGLCQNSLSDICLSEFWTRKRQRCPDF